MAGETEGTFLRVKRARFLYGWPIMSAPLIPGFNGEPGFRMAWARSACSYNGGIKGPGNALSSDECPDSRAVCVCVCVP